jgi:hypothetical protein
VEQFLAGRCVLRRDPGVVLGEPGFGGFEALQVLLLRLAALRLRRLRGGLVELDPALRLAELEERGGSCSYRSRSFRRCWLCVYVACSSL